MRLFPRAAGLAAIAAIATLGLAVPASADPGPGYWGHHSWDRDWNGWGPGWGHHSPSTNNGNITTTQNGLVNVNCSQLLGVIDLDLFGGECTTSNNG
jgi:hypothetical protein